MQYNFTVILLAYSSILFFNYFCSFLRRRANRKNALLVTCSRLKLSFIWSWRIAQVLRKTTVIWAINIAREKLMSHSYFASPGQCFLSLLTYFRDKLYVSLSLSSKLTFSRDRHKLFERSRPIRSQRKQTAHSASYVVRRRTNIEQLVLYQGAQVCSTRYKLRESKSEWISTERLKWEAFNPTAPPLLRLLSRNSSNFDK